MSVSGFDTIEVATAATTTTTILASASTSNSQQPLIGDDTIMATMSGLQPFSAQNQTHCAKLRLLKFFISSNLALIF